MEEKKIIIQSKKFSSQNLPCRNIVFIEKHIIHCQGRDKGKLIWQFHETFLSLIDKQSDEYLN